MAHILVTGGAGFIGSHVCEALLARGDSVRVLDNFDPFYAQSQKRSNLAAITAAPGAERFELLEGDIRDTAVLGQALDGIDAVIHLAALAGVRPSIERPAEYWDVNLVGTQRLLDGIRQRPDVPFIFGSSSSVYGGNKKVPFCESDPVNHPVSPYAASKRAGELQCHAFHHLHGHGVTCLRFFTVFGPRQRPEMAIHKFTRAIENGEPVPLFGDGSSSRDYTFVSDIVQGILAALDRTGGFHIYNLGGAQTTSLKELVDGVATALGKDARLDWQPFQPGDVLCTFADVELAGRELGYQPQVSISEGLGRFVEWYRAARSRGEIA
ncbi:MAG: epimerase [Planctomycetota bacterium]|nr:MAG: epimerase [Planctomycetota bacterium]